MPGTLNVKVVALWEHEIRIAAKAMKHLVSPETLKLPAKERNVALKEALNACMLALTGAEKDDVAIVISSVPTLFLKGGKIVMAEDVLEVEIQREPNGGEGDAKAPQ